MQIKSKLILGFSSKTVYLIVTLLLTNIAYLYAAMPEVPVPDENPITENKRILGKILFWDEQLSSDNTMACGSCHIPSNGGTDPRPATNPGFDQIFGTADDVIGSKGVVHYDENMQIIDDDRFGFDPQVSDRTAPSFINAMYADDLFWDGRALSKFVDPQNPQVTIIAQNGALESQAIAPILSSVEMAKENRSWEEVIAKLTTVTPLALAQKIPDDMSAAIASHNNYPELFNQAFGDSNITAARIAMAIATYERTLVSNQTPWDLYMAGDTTAMTASQIEGWEFFRDGSDNNGQNGGGNGGGNNGGGGMGGGERPSCAMCHTPPLFTDNKYYNIGLRPAQEDSGRMNVSNNTDDYGSFKTPGLRNIGLKSAMMHVGWITDTMDAIDFYNAGTADVTSNHVQFTENQSGLPVDNPNAPMSPPYIMVALEVDSEVNQSKVADFIDNALTDPRVKNETFPFDRPILNSEIKYPINSAISGAWYNPDTLGQGILLEVLPNSNKVFLAWFTFDTENANNNPTSTIGSAEQRWLTGIGEINNQDKSVTFDINVTSGGLFDNSTPVTTTQPNAFGSLTIKFNNCGNALVSYDFLNQTLVNNFPIQRITTENNALCEKLLTQNIPENNPTDTFNINSGLTGAWYNPDTSGQGVLVEVLPESEKIFLAWFTFDSQLPESSTNAIVGDAGNRWLTGIGSIDYENKKAIIDLNLTSGGLFDNAQTVTTTQANSYGKLTLSFTDCANAQIDYDIFSLNLTGTIPLNRVSSENVNLCHYLSNQ